MSLFPTPLQAALNRVTFARKPEQWPTRATASAAAVDALGLPSFSFGEVYGQRIVYPVSSFRMAGLPQYFILTEGKERFLIDTQGYDYARYIARIG